MAGKLGRLPRDPSRRTLVIDNYRTAVPLPPAPDDVDYSTRVGSTWPMYGNDRIGSCTCAAIGHMIQAWTVYSGKFEVTIPEAEILTMYSAVSGYDPATGANDNGAIMQDVLNYMRHTGVKDTGGNVHKVAAFAAFTNPADHGLMKQVLNAFGSVYVGINCPESALQQFDENEPWSYVATSPTAGGHAINLQRHAASGIGVLRYITWAKEQRTTLQFHRHCVEEAWCVVTEDWLTENGTTVEGLNLDQLLADAHAVTN